MTWRPQCDPEPCLPCHVRASLAAQRSRHIPNARAAVTASADPKCVCTTAAAAQAPVVTHTCTGPVAHPECSCGKHQQPSGAVQACGKPGKVDAIRKNAFLPSAPLCLSIGILIKTCSKLPQLPRLLGNSPRLQPQPCL